MLRTVDWSTVESLLFVSGTKMAALVYGTVVWALMIVTWIVVNRVVAVLVPGTSAGMMSSAEVLGMTLTYCSDEGVLVASMVLVSAHGVLVAAMVLIHLVGVPVAAMVPVPLVGVLVPAMVPMQVVGICWWLPCCLKLWSVC